MESDMSFQDRQFREKLASSNLTSVRRYPSVLCKAVQNVTIEEMAYKEAIKEVIKPEAAKPKKVRITLAKKMADLNRQENVREDRDSVDFPVFEPFGDKKFWDFKMFPRIQKNWSEMNEKDQIVAKLIGGIHAIALLAPFYFTP
jgi:hypothetical protein